MTLLLYAAFFVSGITALVYEVVWAKYLALFVGGTSLAHTIVLATFMGGLAFGNAFFGRYADRPGVEKLRLYALLEVGIGITCLLFPTVLGWLGELYVAVGSRNGPEAPANHALKIGLSAASMLLPCALMGGTLPVLAKYTVDSLSGLGVRVSRLYFINAAGAVVGCLAGGFYVVEEWGLEFGMVATSLANSAIGGLFYALSRSDDGSGYAVPGVPSAAHPSEPQRSGYTESQGRTAFWCIGAAGALSMLYELVWIRLLILSIGGTVHSFSTMLASFIAGIALGSALVGLLLRRSRNALALFGLCELGIALSVLLAMPWYEGLPFLFFRVGSWLAHTPETYPIYLLSQVALAGLLMLAPTTLMGATLPLASRVCVDRFEALGRRIGDVFSINTMGNVVGAIITGFVLLPRLGLEPTLLLGALASGVLGVVLLRAWRPRGEWSPLRALADVVRPGAPSEGPRVWAVALAALCLVGGARLSGHGAWDPRLLQGGLYRWEAKFEFPSWEAFKEFRSRVRLVYGRDGSDASVSVEEIEGFRRILCVNGKPDASTGGDLATQLMLGHLGMFLHPQPRRVMVIGLGSGATAGAVLRHPGATADVAEISPEVVEASVYFESVNDGVLGNPRMALSVLDAREFLLLTRRKYDVIVSEPTNVWVPGVANLFTKDFYQLVLDRLEPGGLFNQWIHLYASDRDMVASLLTTLAETFPYVSLWVVEDGDMFVLAARERPSLDLDRLARRFLEVQPARGFLGSNASARMALFADPILFLSTQVATNEAFRLQWPRGAAASYRDIHPRLEFDAARAQFLGRPYFLLEEINERLSRVGAEPLFLDEYLSQHPLDRAVRRRLIGAFGILTPVHARLGHSLALLSILGGDEDARLLADLPDALAAKVLLARTLGADLDRHDRGSTPEVCEAYLRAAKGALAEAASVFGNPPTGGVEARVDACAARHPASADALRSGLVEGMAAAGAVEPALERLQGLIEDGTEERLRGKEAAGLLVIGSRLHLRAGRRREALAWAERATRADPANTQAARLAWALTH